MREYQVKRKTIREFLGSRVFKGIFENFKNNNKQFTQAALTC